MTNYSLVLLQLRRQREKLNQAISALESLSGGRQGQGRTTLAATTTQSGKRKRTMSVAARRRIAAAQKIRWAKWKAEQKKA